jgi:negative regulator of flagellin synthesis FlgM
MHIHGPNLLEGPVTRHRGWWNCPEFDSMETMPNPISCDPRADRQRAERRPPPDAPIRTELVERIRKEIADGAYDTPEKFEAALDRLLDRLEEKDS